MLTFFEIGADGGSPPEPVGTSSLVTKAAGCAGGATIKREGRRNANVVPSPSWDWTDTTPP